jgi:hypothetical protein
MVGRALMLSRLHILGKMGQLTARCTGNQLCRRMAKWIVQNPDCVLETATLALSYGMTGAPDVTGLTGQASVGMDAGFLVMECVDRGAGRSSPRGRHADDGAGKRSPNTCSFAGETEVLLADGATKPIAEIAVGDQVLAADPETGEKGARAVTAVWSHEDELVDLEIGDGIVTTTEDHPFWNASDQAWQPAAELGVGEAVQTADGDRVAVEGIDWATQTGGMAYNLTVAELHTYFVVIGADDVLVHNTCRPDPDIWGAVVPPGKLTYLTRQPIKGVQSGKGNIFVDQLGFAQDQRLDNALLEHLQNNYSSYKYSREMPNGGYTFEVTGSMTGPNGSTWIIKTVWGVDPDGTTRFITAHPT